MYNKKKIATLLVIGMAAMFMMNGCQKKASETETTKQTTDSERKYCTDRSSYNIYLREQFIFF